MLEPRLPTAAGRAGSAAAAEWERTEACRSKESTMSLLAPLCFYHFTSLLVPAST